jgi:hypothetical protein
MKRLSMNTVGQITIRFTFAAVAISWTLISLKWYA